MAARCLPRRAVLSSESGRPAWCCRSRRPAGPPAGGAFQRHRGRAAQQVEERFERLAPTRGLACCFPVDHGRIDAAAEPAPVYHPILRVGALVSYTVSLDHRFQKRAECCLDASTGLEVPAATRHRLDRCAPGPHAGRPTAPHQLVTAVAAAHSVIAAAAAERERALARQVAPMREAELSRTEAYYAEVLAGISRRRRTAAPDRVELLDARAEATKAERARRLAEIVEKHAASHEILPFRLHLVLVPALSLPVDVRRGDRRYPLTLTWLPPAATFAAPRCPSCGRNSPLLAGKDRLSCHDCMPQTATSSTRRS
jgi:hypothetical protein